MGSVFRLRGIRLVTFDATNTLIHVKKPPGDVYCETARELGLPISNYNVSGHFVTEYKKLAEKFPNFGACDAGMTCELWWRTLIRQTFLASGNEALVRESKFSKLCDQLYASYATSERWTTYPCAIQTLQRISDQGIKIGIISNTDNRLPLVLKSLDIANYFEFVTTSYTVGIAKPNPEIFLHARSQLRNNELSDDHCVHIGDDLMLDYHGAKCAGWHAMWLNRDNKEHPNAVGNEVKLCSLKEVIDVLEV